MKNGILVSPFRRSILMHRTGNMLALAVLVAACLVALIPFAFMLGASLMPGTDVTTIPYRWIPEKPLWSNYLRALRGQDGSWIYLRNILNSFIVSSSVAVSSVLLASLTGYGLAKFDFKGRDVVFMAIMGTMMIPFETVMIPLYLTAVKMGLQNRLIGLILPFLTSAFGVFLMRQYLLGFPDELLDAARIDGCTEPQIFRSIVFRNASPAIATLAILAFRGQWDNLLWPLLIVQKDELKTIPLYIVRFTSEMSTDEGAMMAVAVIAALPVFILFFTMSKYFLRGAGIYTGSKT